MPIAAGISAPTGLSENFVFGWLVTEMAEKELSLVDEND